MQLETSAGTVFLYAMITAIATGLGALPFFLVRTPTRQWLGLSNGMAAGLMIAASLMLIIEGWVYSPLLTLLGGALGLVFIRISHYFLDHHDDNVALSGIEGVNAKKILLIMGVMTIHSFTEGVGVGVSFGGGEALGIFITAAIAIHNIPEGLAISLVMVPRGASVWKAMGWSILSSLPQPLMAVPAFLFVEWFRPLLPSGLGFAAGAMLWMSSSELIPDALEDASRTRVALAVFGSGMLMMALQILLDG